MELSRPDHVQKVIKFVWIVADKWLVFGLKDICCEVFLAKSRSGIRTGAEDRVEELKLL